jgi:hypothetical protein
VGEIIILALREAWERDVRAEREERVEKLGKQKCESGEKRGERGVAVGEWLEIHYCALLHAYCLEA